MIVGIDIIKLDVASGIGFAHDVKFIIDMFSPGMELWVPDQAYGCLVVGPQLGGAWWSVAQIIEQPTSPDNLLRRQVGRDILRFGSAPSGTTLLARALEDWTTIQRQYEAGPSLAIV